MAKSGPVIMIGGPSTHLDIIAFMVIAALTEKSMSDNSVDIKYV